MYKFFTPKSISKNLVILIPILVVAFTISNVSLESWRDTYPTPDGRCGTVFDYVLNMPQTARAYASVNKTAGTGGTEVSTYGYISSDYYRDKDESVISAGRWTLNIWYAKDPKNDVETEFVADEYYSITGEKKFWFKKPRDVKGSATAIVYNDINEPDDSYVYLADAWAEFPTEEPPPENEAGDDNEDSPDIGRDPGLFHDDPLHFPEPGESITLNLVTDGPYSQVYWYVKAPSETSHYGTNVEIDEGDGTSNEASLTYTFPSGAMHTGEFKITAYIYPSSGEVYEYSYTVNVTSN